MTALRLFLGSRPGARDHFDSRRLGGRARSVTVSSLPRDGSIVHARLWYRSRSAGRWAQVDAVYVSAP